MYSFQELFFSFSLTAYLTTSVIVAMVRWGHKCEPYARHADYYYPGWKYIVFCYLSNLFLLPAVFFPNNSDYILLVRMMLILGSPALCALMLFSYFGQVLKITWWRTPAYLLVITFILILVAAHLLAVIPGDNLSGFFGRIYFSVAGSLALFYTVSYILALRMVVRALRRTAQENYSNPEDFSVNLAKGAIWVPVIHLLVSWTSTLIGSTLTISIGLLLLSALSIVFLIGILAPHRNLTVEQLEAQQKPMPKPVLTSNPLEEEQAPEVALLSPARQKAIVKAIRKCVEEDKAYLDSHLTLASLSKMIGVNRTYVSAVMSDCLGGFFVYVNRCRLAHAAQLKVEQPDISVGDLIAASGFGSRQSYYNVRRQLEKNI